MSTMVTYSKDLYSLMSELDMYIRSDQESDIYLDHSEPELKALDHMRAAFTSLSAAADILQRNEAEQRSIAAAHLGRKGGSVTSVSKAAAARANGKRGGRPRKGQ